MKLSIQFLVIFLLSIKIASGQTDTVINKRFNIIENSEKLQRLLTLEAREGKPNDKLVVVHFGDSHIQGDYFTGTIRKNLQQVFGVDGEGVLFPYSVCKSFGPRNLTTKITGDWKFATILKNPNSYSIGVSGYTLISADKMATMSFIYNPTDELGYDHKNIYEKVIVWHTKNNFKIKLIDNGAADGIYLDTIKKSNGLYQTIISNYHTGMELKIQFDTTSTDTLFSFHGITFENSHQNGLQYHRSGVVGATFQQLLAQQEFIIAHLKEINPDILIFSYGSNESYLVDFDINLYYKNITIWIETIQKEFPNVCIIFTSTPDTRSQNRFPKNTQAINEKLHKIALENSLAYWDLNKIMGANNSMMYWLNHGLAAKDKLHFTKTGYVLQGNLFSLAFLQLFNNESKRSIQIVSDSLQTKINKQLDTLQSNDSTGSSTILNIERPILVSKFYLVKKNDTLSNIAVKFGVTVKQLCLWNKLTKNSVLQINQKILIKK